MMNETTGDDVFFYGVDVRWCSDEMLGSDFSSIDLHVRRFLVEEYQCRKMLASDAKPKKMPDVYVASDAKPKKMPDVYVASDAKPKKMPDVYVANEIDDCIITGNDDVGYARITECSVSPVFLDSKDAEDFASKSYTDGLRHNIKTIQDKICGLKRKSEILSKMINERKSKFDGGGNDRRT